MTGKWIDRNDIYFLGGMYRRTDMHWHLCYVKQSVNHVPCTSWSPLKYQSREGGSCSITEHLQKIAESGMASLPLEEIVRGPRGSTWQLTIDIFWKPIKCFTAVLPSPSSQPIKSQLINSESPSLGMGYSEENPMQCREENNLVPWCKIEIFNSDVVIICEVPTSQDTKTHLTSCKIITFTIFPLPDLQSPGTLDAPWLCHIHPLPQKRHPQIMRRCEKSRGWDEFRGSLFFPLHLRLHVIVPFWCVLKTPNSIKNIYPPNSTCLLKRSVLLAPSARRNWKLSYIHHRDLNCNHPFQIIHILCSHLSEKGTWSMWQ